MSRAGRRDSEAKPEIVSISERFRRPGSQLESRLTLVFWAVAALLGFLQAWHARFTISHGAVSLLDMGDAYFRGDWAVNGYFNPLYAWMLGLMVRWFRPTAYWEYPLVHLIVFVTYLLALACWTFLLKELLRYRETVHGQRAAAVGFLRPPVWVWLVLGYSIFLWASLDLVTVAQTNPDMLIAAFVYLAAGLLLRIRAGSATWLTFVVLGAVLGLGYLTKSAFFPISFVFLGVALLAAGDLRKALPRIAVSFLVFALLAGPYVLALSVAKRRPTFGDAGRLVYAWYVNGVPMRHWQGSSESGSPIHPTRQLFRVPATYEFAGPVGGTYPAVYDISYWYEGLKIRFSFRSQIATLWRNLQEIGTLFLRLNGSIVLGAVLLAVVSGRKRALLTDLLAYWFLLVPCLAGLLMFALVNVYGRYVGPFVAILALLPFVAIPLPDSREAGRLLAGVAVTALVMLFSPIGPSAMPKYYGELSAVSHSRNLPWQVANEVKRFGILPGGKVASLSYSKERNMAWARLARAQIVVEVFYSPTVPETFHNEFWRASPALQSEILAAFAEAGAQVAIADEEPRWEMMSAGSAGHWQRLGATDFYACRLPRRENGGFREETSGEPRNMSR